MDYGDYPSDQNQALSTLSARRFIEIAAQPTVNDDASSNFGVGCKWVDTTYSVVDEYVCRDNTAGAAVWVQSNLQHLMIGEIPLDADSVLHYPLPYACRIVSLTSTVNRATTTSAQDATIQAALGTVGSFTDITTGLITVAGGSVVATQDSAVITADNIAAAGDILRLTTTDGSQVAAATAIVTAVVAV